MTTDFFKVLKRNPGHWDIITDKGRAFRIRGGPGSYCAMDEREAPYPVTKFKTVGACMTFICDELMHELIVAEGQEATTIEAWNVKNG
jgi:hypothetical protein